MKPQSLKNNRCRAVSASIQIKHLGESDEGRWDAYVNRCPSATFFHLSGWKRVIDQAFGYRTHFLYAEEDGEIQGILPLGHVRSAFFSNALISVPFCVYGGIAADDEIVADMLEHAGKELAARLRVDYLELRQRCARKPTPPANDLYVTFRKQIDPDPTVNMQAIPRKQRAMVRKGIKGGLTSVATRNVERFYNVYSESVRNLGTPVLPLKWFQLVMETFGDACEVLEVVKDGRCVSAVMSYYFRDEVLPYYGGGTREARDLKANDFMYWELMRRAGERNIRVFDYGRSKRGAGSYHFKENWGFEPKPLHYEYQLIDAKQIPEINPMNPKYQLLIKTWKRLPLSVSRAIGPSIAKYLA